MKNNFKPEFYVPKTADVAYLETSQQIKKSNLSVAARNRVIQTHGSNYSSKRATNNISGQIGYGPCEYSECSHDENVRFYLRIGFRQDRLWNWHFKGSGEFNWITMENVAQARDVEKKFENGTYKVVGATGDSSTDNAQTKKAEIMNRIHNYIKRHDDGEDIYDAEVNFNYD